MTEKQSHPEFLRTIDAHPFSVNGHVVQPHRLYFELTEADVKRFGIIADAHDALVEACKAFVAAYDAAAWPIENDIGLFEDARAALKLAEQSGEERA